MDERIHTRPHGSTCRIRLTSAVTDPEYMSIGLKARKSERAHLLGMLRIFLESQRACAVPANKILDALNDWIELRLSALAITEDSQS